MDADVVVIGGGVAGIAAGVALSDAGLRVVLVERTRELGGRARSWKDARSGDTIDIGPHVLHSEYRNMLALMERLGTRERVSWQPGKLMTLATSPRPSAIRHRALPTPFSLLPDLARAGRFSVRDLLSNAKPTWAALRWREDDVAQLDEVNALDYLRAAGVTPHVIEWFWAFAALSVMNVPLERCSAAALLRVHGQLVGYRGIHFGFPTVGLAELYAPQAVRVMHQTIMGNGAAEIERRDGALATVRLADGTCIAARYCICAVPPRELDFLLPGVVRADAFEPSPYISSYLWFDRKLTSERFWAQLGALHSLNTDFYDLSNIRAGWAGRPSLIASNIIHSHRAHAMSDDEIVARTREDIARFAPRARDATVLGAVVNRIPMAINCPLPGSEQARPPARTPVRGVFLAGDWTRTGLPSTMESAARSGFIAAEQVLAALGRPASLAIALRPKDGIAGLVERFRQRPTVPGRASGTRPTAHPARRP